MKSLVSFALCIKLNLQNIVFGKYYLNNLMLSQDPEGLFPCILGHEAAGYVLLRIRGYLIILSSVFIIQFYLNFIDAELWRVLAKV